MRYVLAVTALVGLALLAACGGDDNGDSTGATPTKAAAGEKTVNITLQEWTIVPDVKEVKAGDVTFNVSNKGPKEEHEFVVFSSDLAPDKLPTLADGAADEKGQGLTHIDEIEGIGAGANSSGTFTLTPGNYIFICNLIDQDATLGVLVHYQQGMRTAFTVK